MKYLLILVLIGFAGCTKKSTAPATQATAAPAVDLGHPAASPTATVNDPLKKSCIKGDMKHDFEIIKKDSGCVLNSIVAGKTTEEGAGKLGTGKCEIREKRLVAKLELSGYKCQ